MAWCLWDMLTHPRYGMGKRLGAADVDKWALYVGSPQNSEKIVR